MCEPLSTEFGMLLAMQAGLSLFDWSLGWTVNFLNCESTDSIAIDQTNSKVTVTEKCEYANAGGENKDKIVRKKGIR